ncbi:MAG: alpha-glucuronidase [Alphaproteobacteria bacterium]|nr:alpha-glucuronidase [Alphaproteobacteria bacterium]
MSWRALPRRMTAGLALIGAALALVPSAQAEDGYDLWLRHAPLEGEALERLRIFAPRVEVELYRGDETPTLAIAARELDLGLAKLGGGTVASAPGPGSAIALECGSDPAGAGEYTVRSNAKGIAIGGPGQLSCLYGAYALLRELSQGADPRSLDIVSAPAMPLRMLNHWDNPDGHVERGYSGRSIFDWWHLPERLDQRMIDYARANASVGINGSVVNNVNATAYVLEPRYIEKLARLADAWRPYGIRVFLSARFSAPRELGGLETADPLDPAVRAWWADKADEIYAAIPDFGGFLVKANSEGQPGPQDYGRTHADGANMMAAALGERGTVIWRAFVYSEHDETDRAKQAYAEFLPLDGAFADNVIVQVKNGPIDFQPREPFHPMFGAMPDTRLMLEAQITKEYLGFASHLAYLAPMWEEVLDADTGHGATVAQVVAPVGMAGVANTGSDRNWSGSDFDQANWYAFGRLAWDPSLSSEQIAREWAAQTFSRDPAFVDAVVPMMLASRQAVVDYMTPLGLAHLMGTGHHYGPAPWVCELERPEWNPCYYHRADADGIGFDRTPSGSDALSQYAPSVAAHWSDPEAIDPAYLLWFHRVGWNHPMRSGRSLWAELVARYDSGVGEVDRMAQTWRGLAHYVDPQRHRAVSANLAIQQSEARWWRDGSLSYWQSVNGLELPAGTRPAAESLDHYRSLSFPEAPGN